MSEAMSRTISPGRTQRAFLMLTFGVEGVPLHSADALPCLGVPGSQSGVTLAAARHDASAVCGEGTAADRPIMAAQYLTPRTYSQVSSLIGGAIS